MKVQGIIPLVEARVAGISNANMRTPKSVEGISKGIPSGGFPAPIWVASALGRTGTDPFDALVASRYAILHPFSDEYLMVVSDGSVHPVRCGEPGFTYTVPDPTEMTVVKSKHLLEGGKKNIDNSDRIVMSINLARRIVNANGILAAEMGWGVSSGKSSDEVVGVLDHALRIAAAVDWLAYCRGIFSGPGLARRGGEGLAVESRKEWE